MRATYGIPPEFIECSRITDEPGRGSRSAGRPLEGRSYISPMSSPIRNTRWRGAKLGGFRTVLGVPLLREGVPIGVLVMRALSRGHSPTSRSSCCTTFADQAVIAIENVRLFDEIQDKSRQLERRASTSRSSSPA